MHISPISDSDTTLDLPFEFVQASFRQYGVAPNVLNRLIRPYGKAPFFPSRALTVKKVYWDALEDLLLHPNCTLASLICTPFLVRNNPSFDPSITPMWPVLTAMFNGCLPARGLKTEPVGLVRHSLKSDEHPQRICKDLHMKVLGALVLLPLNSDLRHKLHSEVFDHWSDLQWNALFETLNDWTDETPLENFDVLAFNLRHASNMGHWVHWAGMAMATGNCDLLEAIDRNFHDEMSAYVNNNTDIVLAPHMIKSQQRCGGQYYKIWRVLHGLASYSPSLWGDYNVCKKVLHRAFDFLAGLYLRAADIEDLNAFKNSPECSELQNTLQNIHTDIVQRIIYEMKSSSYSNPSNALEGMLLLGYDTEWVLPYCEGLNFDKHPLCLARYQSFVLNDALSVEHQLAPSREKKI